IEMTPTSRTLRSVNDSCAATASGAAQASASSRRRPAINERGMADADMEPHCAAPPAGALLGDDLVAVGLELGHGLLQLGVLLARQEAGLVQRGQAFLGLAQVAQHQVH